MKSRREFEIAWEGLKPGVSVFEYELNDRFFTAEDAERDYKDLDAQVTLNFDKKTNFFLCHFDIDGSVTVPCDRCGQDFKLRLWDEFDLLIKLGGAEDAEIRDNDADVVFIPRSETVLNIRDWLYEFLTLSVPLQRVHPDKSNGEEGCDPEVIKLLNKLAASEEEKPKSDIWKGLDALKEQNKRKQS